ncbi:MAG: glucosyltransferase, partial [Christensenellales bacterium]
MSTIVFFCIPAYGHTNPTLGVVRELAARGHKVVYYSYDTMRKPIEAAGAAFVSCNAYDAEQRLSPKDGERLGRDLAFSTQVLVDTTLALDNAILSDMRALAPDCIVADSMALWG